MDWLEKSANNKVAEPKVAAESKKTESAADLDWLSNTINSKLAENKKASQKDADSDLASAVNDRPSSTPTDSKKSTPQRQLSLDMDKVPKSEPVPSPTKADQFDWLGIGKEDSDNEEVGFASKKGMQRQTSLDKSLRKSEEVSQNPADWLFSSDPRDDRKKSFDWLDKEDDEDYLGLGREIDPETLIKYVLCIFTLDLNRVCQRLFLHCV